MKYKILVADDSPTIQKVIKITLANEPYILSECVSETDLVKAASANHPDILLLDFNLAENKSGYDLVKEVRKLYPNIKIILLFGTFDNFSEADLEAHKIDNKIIKPFDGTKFINICRAVAGTLPQSETKEDIFPELIQDSPEVISFDEINESKTEKNIEPDLISSDEEIDQWAVNSPPTSIDKTMWHTENKTEVPVKDLKVKKTALDSEVEDWGIEIPARIDGGIDNSIEMPEIILAVDNEHVNIQKLPDQDDLAYPDMQSDITPKMPELVPIDSFNFKDVRDLSERKDDQPQIKKGTTTLQEVKFIEDQIADEVNLIDSYENLWSIDEKVKTKEQASPVIAKSMPEIKAWKEEKENKTLQANTMSNVNADIDYQKLAQALANSESFMRSFSAMIIPEVEKMVLKQSEESVNKVSWDIIPDLAENLIKSELKKLSDSVL